MGLYKKTGSPFWYAAWMEPVADPFSGRMRRRADGTVVTHQVHRSTKVPHEGGRAGSKKAEGILKRWEGEAQKQLHLSLAEEDDRLRVRRAAVAVEEQERLQAAQRAFTLGDLRDLWLKHASQKKSLRDDRDRFAIILDVVGADRPVADLRPSDVIALRDGLLKRESKRGKPYGKATVNRFLALLRSSLKAAALHGHQHANPMLGVKLLREDNARDRICTREEYEKLIKSASPKLRIAIVLGFHTGMRRGDIAALSWDVIDLKERTIRVLSETEKTGEPRIIPITDEVVAELSKIKPKKGPLFPYEARESTKTDYDAGATFGSEFSDLVDELRIPDLHFHDFRHTASTNLRRAGADLFTLAKLTGHRDLKTLQRYQTITVDDLRTAVERSAKAQKRKKRR